MIFILQTQDSRSCESRTDILVCSLCGWVQETLQASYRLNDCASRSCHTSSSTSSTWQPNKKCLFLNTSSDIKRNSQNHQISRFTEICLLKVEVKVSRNALTHHEPEAERTGSLVDSMVTTLARLQCFFSVLSCCNCSSSIY